jgi:hypothetical protein
MEDGGLNIALVTSRVTGGYMEGREKSALDTRLGEVERSPTQGDITDLDS